MMHSNYLAEQKNMEPGFNSGRQQQQLLYNQ